MEKRWWWWFVPLCLCTLAVREDSGVVLFGVGLYMLVSRRFPRIGAAVCLGSLLYVVVVTSQLMPLFSEDVSKRFLQERFGQYLVYLGDRIDEATIFDLVIGILRQPWRFVAEIFMPVETSLLYILGQSLPLALIPIVAPASWLMAGPPLLQILAAKGAVLSLNIRYAMTVVPGLFYGTILWWSGRGLQNFWRPPEQLVSRPLKPKFRRWWTFCIAVSALVCLAFSPNRTLYFLLPDSYVPRVYVSWPEQVRHSHNLYGLLADIPVDASVSASTYIIPHLSGRRELVRFPSTLELNTDDRGTVPVDYVAADLWRLERYQVAFKRDRQLLSSSIATIDRLLESGDYSLKQFVDGNLLLQRNGESLPTAIAEWQTYRQQLLDTIEQSNSV